jgi:hypothetical protein
MRRLAKLRILNQTTQQWNARRCSTGSVSDLNFDQVDAQENPGRSRSRVLHQSAVFRLVAGGTSSRHGGAGHVAADLE